MIHCSEASDRYARGLNNIYHCDRMLYAMQECSNMNKAAKVRKPQFSPTWLYAHSLPNIFVNTLQSMLNLRQAEGQGSAEQLNVS